MKMEGGIEALTLGSPGVWRLSVKTRGGSLWPGEALCPQALSPWETHRLGFSHPGSCMVAQEYDFQILKIEEVGPKLLGKGNRILSGLFFFWGIRR